MKISFSYPAFALKYSIIKLKIKIFLMERDLYVDILQNDEKYKGWKGKKSGENILWGSSKIL